MKKIDKWSRIVICIAYIAILIWWINNEISALQYPRINPYKLEVLWGDIWMYGIIPMTIIGILFIKNEKKWIKIIQNILRLMIPVYFLQMIIIGMLGSGYIFCSHTYEIKNYRKFDEEIQRQSNSGEFSILPSKLPEEIRDIQYEYFYNNSWEPSYKIRLAFTCNCEEQYRELTTSLEQEEIVKGKEVVGSKEVIKYRLVHGSDLAQVICDENSLYIEYYIMKGIID